MRRDDVEVRRPFSRRLAGWVVLLFLSVALVWGVFSLVKNGEQALQGKLSASALFDFNVSPFGQSDVAHGSAANADVVEAEAARRNVEQVWLTGSLRGSDLDGDWGHWEGGVLQPSLSLRRRFDYLLTALGEVDHYELRYWIEAQVMQELGALATRQVLAVWDAYIVLQRKTFTAQIDLGDMSTWRPALNQRIAARRETLGKEWADAFFFDEEQAFLEIAERFLDKSKSANLEKVTAASAEEALLVPALESGSVEQVQQLHLNRIQKFGVEAAERLRVEDAAWADWERRLAEARGRLDEIASTTKLSAQERMQEQAAVLAHEFSGDELKRAQALLGVDS